jgi:hypothetical protein
MNTINYGPLTLKKGKIHYQRGAIVSTKREAVSEKDGFKERGWYSFIKKVGKEYVIYHGWK